MGLIDYLKNPDSFNIGITVEGGKMISPNVNLGYGGHSKGLRYGENTGGRSGEKDIPSYHLFPRVTWFGDDAGGENSPIFNSNPTFEIGRSHSNTTLDGGGPRGGVNIFEDRKDLDLERIKNFLGSSQGHAFKRRQVALQALNNHANPGQRVWNLGVNLKAQILASGLSHIKRAGALPIPAIGEALNLTDALGGLGMVLEADYLSYQKKNHYIRENKYSTGDPGARPSGNSGLLKALIGNVEEGPEKRREYNVPISDRENLVDKINLTRVFNAPNGVIPNDYGFKDFINFNFEVIDSNNISDTNYIIFRAYLDTFSDSYSAAHNQVKYNGRGENFYTYNSFDRKISLAFKIAAQTRYEMKPLYQKLNYLVAQTAPNYSSTGRIRTPYMRITVGDYLKRVPGVLTSVSVDWQKDYAWEIKADNDKDSDMKVLPHALDVNISFQPIHSFTPNNSINAPFIGIGGSNSSDLSLASNDSWLGNSETTDENGNILAYDTYSAHEQNKQNQLGEQNASSNKTTEVDTLTTGEKNELMGKTGGTF